VSTESSPSYSSSSLAKQAASPKLEPLDRALRSRGLRLHYTTWLRLIRAKGLPAKKVGGRYYINLAQLDDWIAGQSVAVQPAAPVGGLAAMRPAAAEAVLASRRSRRATCPRASGGRP
jgi:excisionase family DNA binding protein